MFHDIKCINYMTKLYEKVMPVGNCMFKVNNRNIRAKCEICSKLTIETLEPSVKSVQQSV